MKNASRFAVILIGTSMLAACGHQSTPSMMNTSRPQVVAETTMDQKPVSSVTEGYLYSVASNYDRYGTAALNLSLAYDPDAKGYGTTKAFSDLTKFKAQLEKFGVRSIRAETVKSSGVEPTLMISYDSAAALAPAGCRSMPGLDDGLTTREIGDYRFGCSVDSMLAKQIYRPTDLYGVASSEVGDGRRATNNVEYYRRVEQDEAEGELQRLQRADIQE